METGNSETEDRKRKPFQELLIVYYVDGKHVFAYAS